MSSKFYVYQVSSDSAAEIYITAVTDPSMTLAQQAQQIYSKIAEILTQKNASVFMERIFGARNIFSTVSQVRNQTFSRFIDDVAPAHLACKDSGKIPFAGVQVHALSCTSKPKIVTVEDRAVGRYFENNNHKILALSGLAASEPTDPAGQSKQMLEIGEKAINQFGGTFLSVPRTWMWLGDILSWYDDFNSVRSNFFVEKGLLGEGGRNAMPASTGIGLGPDNGRACSLDLVAVLKPDNIEYLHAAGKQQCAFEYGSAFSRASSASTPAGRTIYISGTASIDASGATTNLDDSRAQILETIENVRAVLKDMDCSDDDVVQAMAYCKTPEDEKNYYALRDQMPDWPFVPMVCDVCRDNLLFEVEVTALKKH